MTSGVLSVRLPDALKTRLDTLAASTGRPAAYYVREALSEHLTELEYAYTLQAEAEAARTGRSPAITWAELLDELDITRRDLDALPDQSDTDQPGR